MTSAQAPAAPPSDSWAVVCDFDGTMCDVDVTDALLGRFALPAWLDIERRWQMGEMSARQCMQEQVRLLRAAPEELGAFLETIEIDPGFRDFAAFCRKRGLPLSIASDGLDAVICRILSRHGLEDIPVMANRLRSTGPRTYELDFPHASLACVSGHGVCKCALASQARRRVLLVGDGASDFCLARRADFVLAKKSLIRHCESLGIAHRGFSRFAEAPALLAELLDDVPKPDKEHAVGR